MTERWDLLDAAGHPLGRTVEKNGLMQPGEYHLFVEAWLVNRRGEVLIQQRSERCALLPGWWGLTTGRAVAGENGLQACLREVREELGITLDPTAPQLLRRIVREPESHQIWEIYAVPCALPLSALTLQEEEVACAAWVDAAAFRAMHASEKLFDYPEILEILAEVTAKATDGRL